MPVRSEITVTDQLRKIPPAVRPTVRAARRVMKAVAPKAKEIAYQGQAPHAKSAIWKIARYAVDDVDVAGLGVRPTYATLFFHQGRALDDDSGLLEGSGKVMRSIRLSSPEDVERPAVKRIVRRAFQLARSG
jgi:hypothetical protein